MECKKCNKNLNGDEIALTKKLINRGSKEFYCIDCLSSHFDVKREALEEKIEYYKKSGCILFEK